MSVQVRYRREAASFLASFVGAQGELLIDTTNNRVQVHDGATPGGFPAAKLSEVVTNTRTQVVDASYTALASDRAIAVTTLTAARTITLPAASAFPTGIRLLVVDESGGCTSANSITMTPAGTDTINGVSSAAIVTAYGYLAFESNGTGKWTIIDQAVSGGGGGSAGPKNNFAATADPSLANDTTQGYVAGSFWLRTDTGDMWRCRSASTGAAVWNRLDVSDFFGYVPGNWYRPEGQAGGAANGGANTLYFVPVRIKQRMTIGVVGVCITTAATGNAQIAIYKSDLSSKNPTGAPVCTTVSMSTSASGIISAAVNQQFESGLYWFAYAPDNATAAVRVLANVGSCLFTQLKGSVSQANASGSTGAYDLCLYANMSSFGAWPSISGSPPEIYSGYAPFFHFSVASVP